RRSEDVDTAGVDQVRADPDVEAATCPASLLPPGPGPRGACCAAVRLAHPAGPGGSGGVLPRREVVPRSARPRPEAHASAPPWSPEGLRILYGDNTDGQS